MREWFEKIDAFVCMVGSVLLLAGLTLVLILSCITVVSALRDLKDTNRRVVATLESGKQVLESARTGGDEDQTDADQRVYLEELKTRSRGMLDSNVISFLFQIFTVALVSSGVYVLARSQRNLRKAEETTRRVVRVGKAVGPFVANGPVSSTLSTLFVIAAAESKHLKNVGKDVERTSRTSQMLELLTQLFREITRASREGRGMERPQYDAFLDQIGNIKRNIANVSGTEELQALCGKVAQALVDGRFVDRYHDQLRKVCLGARNFDHPWTVAHVSSRSPTSNT